MATFSIAGAAGAQLAFIRPVCPARYRDLQLDAGGPVLIRVSYALTAGCNSQTRYFATRYANRQSGHVEGVAILWVRLPLWSLTNTIPWSNGEDAWPTSRKVLVRFQPGSLLTTWSVSVWAARRCGKAEDRVQFPDGPLEFRGAGPTGRRLACTQVIGVRCPGAPLFGLIVQREDTALAWRQSGFDSR